MMYDLCSLDDFLSYTMQCIIFLLLKELDNWVSLGLCQIVDLAVTEY